MATSLATVQLCRTMLMLWLLGCPASLFLLLGSLPPPRLLVLLLLRVLVLLLVCWEIHYPRCELCHSGGWL
jgi:hypothetical protein